MKWYQVVSIAKEVRTLRERVIMLRYAYMVNLIALIVGLYEWLMYPMFNCLNNDVTQNCNIRLSLGRAVNELHLSYQTCNARITEH